MDIAKEPGEYTDFSGRIVWHSTSCYVEKGDFELKERNQNEKSIIFHDVILRRGKLFNCLIENGINFGCDLSFCTINYMIQKRGTVSSCTWINGVWDGGEWEIGKDKKGDFKCISPDLWDNKSIEIINTPGKYRNKSGHIIWKGTDCLVKNADFELFKTAKDGYDLLITKGTLEKGLAYKCVLKEIKNNGCNISNSIVFHIIHNKGTFYKSQWGDKSDNGGIWKGGIWIESTDRNNEKQDSSPATWGQPVVTKPGIYRNYTGLVKAPGFSRMSSRTSVFYVKNCSLEIHDAGSDPEVDIFDGILLEGKIYNSKIFNAININCSLYDCFIKYIINKGGSLISVIVEDGLFENGHFFDIRDTDNHQLSLYDLQRMSGDIDG